MALAAEGQPPRLTEAPHDVPVGLQAERHFARACLMQKQVEASAAGARALAQAKQLPHGSTCLLMLHAMWSGLWKTEVATC